MPPGQGRSALGSGGGGDRVVAICGSELDMSEPALFKYLNRSGLERGWGQS
jgi:hypothetical protein